MVRVRMCYAKVDGMDESLGKLGFRNMLCDSYGLLSAGRLNKHKEESMKEKLSEIVEMGGDEWEH